MTDPVFRCDDHGYHEDRSCPTCERSGELVLQGNPRRRLSKFVSGALRHFPDDAGVELDDAGWTTREELITAVESKYDWASAGHLDAVIATDPKGRFERDERRGETVVRAAYGHSVDVDLGGADGPVPDTLYHGTAPRNLDDILSDGLKPMGRQQVHLSGSVDDAREVGTRHADDPVLLEIDAAGMRSDGLDIVARGLSTYTTDRVPPSYLRRIDR
ncbi:putative RNA 2'-phosphotransferase [Halomicrobium zhouii]|uniref:Probable RNA 2'-phosphotransferase n=1 Tax=Halomicrobium zhouii TaxID=767519 RepID=A0A1I6KPZ2_9EURY|nr:RNA 2'-phosphotransferase [Halomicrobium zhouii]SFR93322.1 putative RNA 2'-phosphotransferase [Halomicrobium zhouii]